MMNEREAEEFDLYCLFVDVEAAKSEPAERLDLYLFREVEPPQEVVDAAGL